MTKKLTFYLPFFIITIEIPVFFRSAKTLSKIETHLDTNNATEAWILLAIVAPNIQGHNPERVSKLLLLNLKYDMVRNLTSNNTFESHFQDILFLICRQIR